jgi:long-chain acyl-CoA synthetase
MIGYIDDEKETADIMKLHPDGRVWIHTGDLGYVDEDGFVFIEGRIKRIYLTEVNGALAKLFPDRIEKTIEGCSLVKKCACICKENSHNIFQAIAFIVVSDKTNTNEAKRKIYEICKEKLPEYAIPAKIVVVDTIPVTSVGKTDYNSLMKSDL